MPGEIASDEKVKTESLSDRNLTPETVDLVAFYERVIQFEKKEVISPIHVDELASRFALLYENIRRVIDWKDEHLIRRTAIERALKRRMISTLSGISLLTGVTGKRVAGPLVMEVIRAGYFPNDKISNDKIDQVEKVLNKYIYILKNSSIVQDLSPLAIKTKVNFYNWILEVAACEVDEALDPSLMEAGMVNFMTNMMYKRVKVIPETLVDDQEKLIQLYIAVQRTLYNLDDPLISYNILKYRYPVWNSNPEQIIQKMTLDIYKVWKSIEKDLSHSLRSEFYKICEKHDATYLVLGDALKKLSEEEKDMTAKILDWDSFQKTIKEVYDQRVSTLKSRLSRSAVYSTLSIFLAGGLSLFVFEVPLAHFFYGRFSPLAMVIDILIPTIMMAILVTLIRPPGKRNFERLTEEAEKLIYEKSGIDTYEIKPNKKKKLLRNVFFGVIYLLATVISFGLVFGIFYLANVPWTSLYVDTANIAVIVFAALVIRQKAKEVTVEETAGIGDFVIDVFTIPLAKLGQWLSSKWKEYNILSVFFTLVIDVPILTVVELIEDWRSFLKDKKAGIH